MPDEASFTNSLNIEDCLNPEILILLEKHELLHTLIRKVMLQVVLNKHEFLHADFLDRKEDFCKRNNY